MRHLGGRGSVAGHARSGVANGAGCLPAHADGGACDAADGRAHLVRHARGGVPLVLREVHHCIGGCAGSVADPVLAGVDCAAGIWSQHQEQRVLWILWCNQGYTL